MMMILFAALLPLKTEAMAFDEALPSSNAPEAAAACSDSFFPEEGQDREEPAPHKSRAPKGSQPPKEALSDPSLIKRKQGLKPISVHKLRAIAYQSDTASLDAPLGPESDFSMMDMIPDPNSEDPETRAAQESLSKKIAAILKGLDLSDADYVVIYGRFMTSPEDRRTFVDIGQELKVSHQAVQLRAARLQRKLYKALRPIFMEHSL